MVRILIRVIIHIRWLLGRRRRALKGLLRLRLIVNQQQSLVQVICQDYLKTTAYIGEGSEARSRVESSCRRTTSSS